MFLILKYEEMVPTDKINFHFIFISLLIEKGCECFLFISISSQFEETKITKLKSWVHFEYF